MQTSSEVPDVNLCWNTLSLLNITIIIVTMTINIPEALQGPVAIEWSNRFAPRPYHVVAY